MIEWAYWVCQESDMKTSYPTFLLKFDSLFVISVHLAFPSVQTPFLFKNTCLFSFIRTKHYFSLTFLFDKFLHNQENTVKHRLEHLFYVLPRFCWNFPTVNIELFLKLFLCSLESDLPFICKIDFIANNKNCDLAEIDSLIWIRKRRYWLVLANSECRYRIEGQWYRRLLRYL